MGVTSGEKSDALIALKQFQVAAKAMHGRDIGFLRTDNGDYTGDEFESHLRSEKIEHHTVPGHPHQNGVAERMNRTIMTLAWSLKIDSNAPKRLWGELVECAVWHINRRPSKAIGGRIPFDLWNKLDSCVL
jgi:transposase InsO family protein